MKIIFTTYLVLLSLLILLSLSACRTSSFTGHHYIDTQFIYRDTSFNHLAGAGGSINKSKNNKGEQLFVVGHYTERGLLMTKIDAKGALIWSKLLGIKKDSIYGFNTHANLQDSRLYNNYTSSISLVDDGTSYIWLDLVSTGKATNALVKLDTEGNVLWAKQFFKRGNISLVYLQEAPNQYLYITGVAVRRKGFALLLNPSGGLVWGNYFGNRHVVFQSLWDEKRQGFLTVGALAEFVHSGGEASPSCCRYPILFYFTTLDGEVHWVKRIDNYEIYRINRDQKGQYWAVGSHLDNRLNQRASYSILQFDENMKSQKAWSLPKFYPSEYQDMIITEGKVHFLFSKEYSTETIDLQFDLHSNSYIGAFRQEATHINSVTLKLDRHTVFCENEKGKVALMTYYNPYVLDNLNLYQPYIAIEPINSQMDSLSTSYIQAVPDSLLPAYNKTGGLVFKWSEYGIHNNLPAEMRDKWQIIIDSLSFEGNPEKQNVFPVGDDPGFFTQDVILEHKKVKRKWKKK